MAEEIKAPRFDGKVIGGLFEKVPPICRRGEEPPPRPANSWAVLLGNSSGSTTERKRATGNRKKEKAVMQEKASYASTGLTREILELIHDQKKISFSALLEHFQGRFSRKQLMDGLAKAVAKNLLRKTDDHPIPDSVFVLGNAGKVRFFSQEEAAESQSLPAADSCGRKDEPPVSGETVEEAQTPAVSPEIAQVTESQQVLAEIQGLRKEFAEQSGGMLHLLLRLLSLQEKQQEDRIAMLADIREVRESIQRVETEMSGINQKLRGQENMEKVRGFLRQMTGILEQSSLG
ncbi:hypothetical protein AB4090_05390 [Acidithiobacillus sp. IBUN Pt1247-S3]|uniref:hypothetical protein n=1 Tax=Acidithiobacillus sp. IBUN Pt1247-S3 TaxID=3166642 RepID=UPI0034E47A2D